MIFNINFDSQLNIHLNIVSHNKRLRSKFVKVNHTGCGLIVGVFVLHSERSGSSDNPNKANPSKARVVYVVLPIAVTWHGVDKPTLKRRHSFSLSKKKKKKKKKRFVKVSRIRMSEIALFQGNSFDLPFLATPTPLI